MLPRAPTQQLPDGYALSYSLNLKSNTKAIILMQLGTLPAFVLFSWLFIWLTLNLRFDAFMYFGHINTVAVLIGLVLVNFVVIIVHELSHGLFIWVFTHKPPVYGWGLFYAYAGAPDWYFNKQQYVVIALAPLVLISTVGVFLMLLVSPFLVVAVLGILIFNATGAVGDLWLVWKTFFEPKTLLIRDTGDGFEFYRPN